MPSPITNRKASRHSRFCIDARDDIGLMPGQDVMSGAPPKKMAQQSAFHCSCRASFRRRRCRHLPPFDGMARADDEATGCASPRVDSRSSASPVYAAWRIFSLLRLVRSAGVIASVAFQTQRRHSRFSRWDVADGRRTSSRRLTPHDATSRLGPATLRSHAA